MAPTTKTSQGKQPKAEWRNKMKKNLLTREQVEEKIASLLYLDDDGGKEGTKNIMGALGEAPVNFTGRELDLDEQVKFLKFVDEDYQMFAVFEYSYQSAVAVKECKLDDLTWVPAGYKIIKLKN